jgi:hypothetical protein
MSPLCKEQLDRLRQHFNGKVHILHDNGDTVIVIVDPADVGPFTGAPPPDRGEKWKRIDEPALMLIDPARAKYPRVVN